MKFPKNLLFMKFPKNLLLLLAANVARAGDAAQGSDAAAEAQAGKENLMVMEPDPETLKDYCQMVAENLKMESEKASKDPKISAESREALEESLKQVTELKELLSTCGSPDILALQTATQSFTREFVQDARIKLTAFSKAKKRMMELPLSGILFRHSVTDIKLNGLLENAPARLRNSIIRKVEKESFKELLTLQESFTELLMLKFLDRNLAAEIDTNSFIAYLRSGGTLPTVVGISEMRKENLETLFSCWRMNMIEINVLKALSPKAAAREVRNLKSVALEERFTEIMKMCEALPRKDYTEFSLKTLRELEAAYPKINKNKYKERAMIPIASEVHVLRYPEGARKPVRLTDEQKQTIITMLEKHYICEKDWSTNDSLKNALGPENGAGSSSEPQFGGQVQRQGRGLEGSAAGVNARVTAPAPPQSQYSTTSGDHVSLLYPLIPVVILAMVSYLYLWYTFSDFQKAQQASLTKAKEVRSTLDNKLLKLQKDLKEGMEDFRVKMQEEIEILNTTLRSKALEHFRLRALESFRLSMNEHIKELRVKTSKDDKKKDDSTISNKEMPQNQTEAMSSYSAKYLQRFQSKADKNIENLLSKLKSGEMNEKVLKNFGSKMEKDIEELIKDEIEFFDEINQKELHEKLQAIRVKLKSSEGGVSKENKA